MLFCVCFQAEDGIRDLVRSRALGDVYKRQGDGIQRRAKAPEDRMPRLSLLGRSAGTDRLGGDAERVPIHEVVDRAADAGMDGRAGSRLPVSYTHPTLPASGLV